MFAKHIENGLDLTGIAASVTAIYDTRLEPGQDIPSHFHPDLEEVYYILLGNGTIIIGEEGKEISRGDVVHIPQLMPHTLLNTGDIPLRFITVSVKVPQKNIGE